MIATCSTSKSWKKEKKNKTKKTQISHINLCAKYEIIISQKWQTLNPIAKFPNV